MMLGLLVTHQCLPANEQMTDIIVWDYSQFLVSSYVIQFKKLEERQSKATRMVQQVT